MSKQDKKLAVLTALKKSRNAISIIELLELLGSGYAERSVRRWLTELAEEGKILKTGHKRGTQYQAITFDFSPRSIEALKYINQPIFDREPKHYDSDWLESYIPNTTFYLPEIIRTELFEQGKRTETEDRAGTYIKKIYHRMLINLSFNSSRLEGNTYSLLDTERLIIKGNAADKKSDEEKIMILNHKEAIRHLVDNAEKIKIDYNEICTLHYLLSDGLIEPEKSGYVRNESIKISGSQYIPLSSKERIEIQLEKICKKANKIENVFEQSFFVLVQLAYLQAFSDVNKRTSRLSANIPLIRENFAPLSFNDIDKDDYIDAILCIYELNDTAPLADLYKFSYLRSCKVYDIHAEEVSYDEFRAKYRNVSRELISQIIKEKLIGKKLNIFLDEKIPQKIKDADQKHFRKNVLEDLELLSPQRIAGLGITKKQLQDYLELKS